MPDALIVLCTCGEEDEAEQLARTLVEERLAACVNVLRGVTSVYRWEGKVTREAEVLLVIKTGAERFEQLRNRIVELHSYETPEVVAFPVTQGSAKYLEWLRAQL